MKRWIRAVVVRAMRPELERLRAELEGLRTEMERTAAQQRERDAQLQAEIAGLREIAGALSAIHGREHDLIVRFDMIGPHLGALEERLLACEEALERLRRSPAERWDQEAVVRRLAAIEDRLTDS